MQLNIAGWKPALHDGSIMIEAMGDQVRVRTEGKDDGERRHLACIF